MAPSRRPEAHGPTTRSERADAVTVLIVGVLAALTVAWMVVLRALQTFRADGIAWILPIDQQPIDATLGSESASLQGYATQALVIAPHVDAVSTAAIVLAHLVWAAAAFLVVGGALWIAWSFLRGRFFAQGTVRALAVISWTLAITPAVQLLLDAIGRNGVLEALHAEDAFTDQVTVAWDSLPVVAAGIALGLVTIAFRRGIRLQKETEGLV